MSGFIDRKLAAVSRELILRQQNPSAALTFGDCFYKDSLRLAECFAASAKYHFEIQSFQMFGTVVDCFSAVDKLVMRDKAITLGDLLRALECDYEGCDDILALVRRAPKYGNDDELANAHAERLSHTACELIRSKSRPYFESQKLFLMPAIQSDTWHLKYGELYGATPDGRRAGKVFSQNTNPVEGVATNGITALLNSLLHIRAGEIASGALNLDIDARQFESEEQKEGFSVLLASYFNRGGLHAQVSVTDADSLRKAQISPDEHRDIRVRVTGYSGIFVDMCERLQNDIINRFE
jgi:formate C-acetyltransferase